MIFKIDASQRLTEKKSELSKLRKTGLVPAVVYGADTEPIKISINKADFLKLYKMSFKGIVFYEIQVGGKSYHTLLKERQIHPVTREIIHIDFMVIPANQTIEIDVPIRFVGTAIGTKEGGIIDIVHRTLKIQCVEDQIPEDIEVDISAMNVGEAYHVHQVPIGNWTVKDHPDTTLITIHAKKVETAPAPEAKPEESTTEQSQDQQ